MNILTAAQIRSAVLALILPVSFIISSCGEDAVVEPEPPPASTMAIDTIRNLSGDTAITGKFTYFSLSTKSVITGDDTTTNKWDIAFRGTTIWINGGTARYGDGGAIVAGAPTYSSIYSLTNFDTISVAPTSGYGQDNSPTSLAIPTGSDNGWYNYEPTSNYISPIAGRVLLIKTGTGKYAKVEILSYYKNSTPDPIPNPTNFR
jgi:hypothetical protein